MTLHKPMSIPSNCSLVTVLVTTLENHQSVCLDMNRVVCCKCLFLFFSSKYTQLCSILTLRVNAINGLRDKGMKSTSYKTKKGISRMTLNHLVKGSNPLRPIDSTTIEDFTLDRSLDRQENHSEANPKAYKDYRDSMDKPAGVASPAPCQPKGGKSEDRDRHYQWCWWQGSHH